MSVCGVKTFNEVNQPVCKSSKNKLQAQIETRPVKLPTNSRYDKTRKG